MSDPSRRVVPFLLVALVLLAAGCGQHLQNGLGLPNQRPVVRLESAPVTGDAQTASAALHWSATDPDGRVDHYLVTDDLRSFARPEGWSTTEARDRVVSLRRAQRSGALPVPERERLRFFAVKAMDERGLASDPAYRAYFDDQVAPTVEIVQPRPSALVVAQVPPTVIIRWVGSAPGATDGKPLRYKFKLFFLGDPTIPWNAWLANPDSIRRTFAPGFVGWDSLPGDSTQVRYSNLIPNREYLFVITAIGLDGTYDPVFSLDKNVLRMVSTEACGPRLTLFTDFYTVTVSPGQTPGSPILAPFGRPLTFHWYGVPPFENPAPLEIAGYRWAIDPLDLTSERRNRNDVRHWSPLDPLARSVTVDERMLTRLGDPDGTQTHTLYVEAVNSVGCVSVVWFPFAFVTPTYDRDLLIVDDTRFASDQIAGATHPDSIRPPVGTWPTRAELDTFLFARGGVRWRMTPPGTISSPGLFHGYSFDTLGTRQGLENPTVSLDLLGHYRHVVWMTDLRGSDLTRVVSPIPDQTTTTLRYLSGAGRQNTLAAWVQGGGRLWALGGGFGNATNAPWFVAMPALKPWIYRSYISYGPRPDLTPGRFMYDLAHWQSGFASAGNVGRPGLLRSGAAPVTMPYQMQLRNPMTDPFWPYRNNTSYPTVANIEFLTDPNHVLEDVNPSPVRTKEVQVLDTLMVVGRGDFVEPPVHQEMKPVMTYYHGSECGPVVFSGFDIWSWRRPDCQGLVDGVLQGLWGLSKTAPAAAASAGAPAGGRLSRR